MLDLILLLKQQGFDREILGWLHEVLGASEWFLGCFGCLQGRLLEILIKWSRISECYRRLINKLFVKQGVPRRNLQLLRVQLDTLTLHANFLEILLLLILVVELGGGARLVVLVGAVLVADGLDAVAEKEFLGVRVILARFFWRLQLVTGVSLGEARELQVLVEVVLYGFEDFEGADFGVGADIYEWSLLLFNICLPSIVQRSLPFFVARLLEKEDGFLIDVRVRPFWKPT